MKQRLLTRIIIGVGLAWSISANAQSSKAPTKPPTENPGPSQKKPLDIDSFFEKAEKQTRKAQEKGDSNCVPKPKSKDPVKPIA